MSKQLQIEMQWYTRPHCIRAAHTLSRTRETGVQSEHHAGVPTELCVDLIQSSVCSDRAHHEFAMLGKGQENLLDDLVWPRINHLL